MLFEIGNSVSHLLNIHAITHTRTQHRTALPFTNVFSLRILINPFSNWTICVSTFKILKQIWCWFKISRVTHALICKMNAGLFYPTHKVSKHWTDAVNLNMNWELGERFASLAHNTALHCHWYLFIPVENELAVAMKEVSLTKTQFGNSCLL